MLLPIWNSDQGLEFKMQLFKEMCTTWGITKTRTTPYAPWSDVMVEHTNHMIKGLLKHYVQKLSMHDWDQWFWAVVMTYNTTVHASMGCTPAKLFLTHGTEFRLPVDLVYGTRAPSLQSDICPMNQCISFMH